MPKAPKVTPRGDLIARLIAESESKTIERFALDSGIAEKLVARAARGELSTPSAIERIAAYLCKNCRAVKYDELVVPPQASLDTIALVSAQSAPTVSGRIDFSGVVTDRSKAGTVMKMQEEIIGVLTKYGIDLGTLNAAFMLQAEDQTLDDTVTILTLCKGEDANNQPFWAYCTLKPSRAADFRRAREEGNVNLLELVDIIEAGHGHDPPERTKERMVRERGVNHYFEEDLINTVERLKREEELLEAAELLKRARSESSELADESK